MEPDQGINLYYKMERERTINREGDASGTYLYHVPFVSADSKRVTLIPGENHVCDVHEVRFSATGSGDRLTVWVHEHKPLVRNVIVLREALLEHWVSGKDEGTSFDIDLRVFSEDGSMVGMCYESGEYKVEIPGARTSGNIGAGGPEWISVPGDIKIYYEIDTTPMDNWLVELHQMGFVDAEDLKEIDREMEAVLQEINYDKDGERREKESTITGSPPYQPANPQPLDEAKGVSLTPQLKWSGGDPDLEDRVTYRIYFGTSKNPPLVKTLEDVAAAKTTFAIDPRAKYGDLEEGTTYYWQVRATDTHGLSSSSPLWSFTTKGEPDSKTEPLISINGPHSLALKIDGTVWAWGCNERGQLGNKAGQDSLTPVKSLLNLTDVDPPLKPGLPGVGLYDPFDGVFHLEGVTPFRYGPRNSDWQPLSGDWNGDGKHGVGLHHDGNFHLDQSAGLGAPHRYGPRGDTDWLPVTGR